MAERLMPFVRLIFPVREASIDLADQTWELRDPLAIMYVPHGGRFPFLDEIGLCVYAQLVGGLGRCEVAIEMRQKRDDGTYRFVGIGATTSLEFEAGPRLAVKATAFGFRRVPFREEGLYEFRVIARIDEGTSTPIYQALNGPVAELRVLDPGGKL
jgi:hypothetical protein